MAVKEHVALYFNGHNNRNAKGAITLQKERSHQTGDFTTNRQILKLSAAALVIGVMCGFIAVALLKLIYFFTNLSFFGRLSFSYITPTHNHLHAWVILIPITGALAVGLMARYGSEKIRGHGIPEAMEAMLINESKVQPRVAFWKPISSAISIGTGGPFGAEGPIIMTGGAFGSLFSQLFSFSSVERRILLAAGAAGGMSATFAAPVASVLFAVELLVFELKPRSLVPIAIASAVADAIRTLLLGPGPMFAMPNLPHVSWNLLAVAAVIGLAGSLVAVLLTFGIYGVEDWFRKLPIHWMWWPALGAVVIGVGGYFSPRALGVGYGSIDAMLNVRLTLGTLALLLLVKTVIWTVGLGSGTSGGILAPILIIGGSLGGVAGLLFHATHPGMWALLGMSAIFSGVTRTPFTSIVFPLELTNNVGALLPLLIAATIATGMSSWILPRSILTEKLARRGLHLTLEYSTDVLQMHYVRELLRGTSKGAPLPERSAGESLVSVCETDTAKTALELMVTQGANVISVISSDGEELGTLTLEDFLCLRKRNVDEESRRTRAFPSIHRRDHTDIKKDSSK